MTLPADTRRRTVTLRFVLLAGGMLADTPAVVATSGDPGRAQRSPAMEDLVQSARRALLRCAPFRTPITGEVLMTFDNTGAVTSQPGKIKTDEGQTAKGKTAKAGAAVSAGPAAPQRGTPAWRREINNLGLQVLRCMPLPARLPKGLAIDVRFRLLPGGGLDGAPRILLARGGATGKDIASRLVQAIRVCAPYDTLLVGPQTMSIDTPRRINLD